MSDFDPAAPLHQVRAQYQARLQDGLHCPVCERWHKINGRNISASNARFLVLAARAHRRDWFQIKPLITRFGISSSATAMKHWNLIEGTSGRRQEGDPAGSWRLTELGIEFVLGRVGVPETALILDDVCIGFAGREDFMIWDARDFDYQEAMNFRSPVGLTNTV